MELEHPQSGVHEMGLFARDLLLDKIIQFAGDLILRLVLQLVARDRDNSSRIYSYPVLLVHGAAMMLLFMTFGKVDDRDSLHTSRC